MTHRYRFLSLVTVCFSSIALAVGCDSSEPVETGEVEGTVKLAGKPLAAGTVAFQDTTTGATDAAKIGAGGQFKLESPLPVGTYQVSITPPPPPRPDDEAAGKLANAGPSIPDKYQDGSTSGETVEVKKGPNTFTIDFAE